MRALLARLRHGRITPLEAELLAARAQPPKQLVDSIVAAVRPRSGARPARLRLAFAGGLTVALVAVAGATGGLSYAASAIAQVTRAVHITNAGQSQSPNLVAACSQYAQLPIITHISPTYGMVGTKVTITGNHFAAPSAIKLVRFSGPVSAPFTINSATQLTTHVPHGAKTGFITATNCKGYATSGKFTVYSKTPCVVPYVIGARLAGAKQRIVRAHCSVGHISYNPPVRRKHPVHIYWYVKAQYPRAGTVLPNGSPVSLTTRPGPK